MHETTLPADLTAGIVPKGPAAEYGALNAGFSQLADDRGIHLWSLVKALSNDGSDGMFDGHFVAGPLYVETTSGWGDLFQETGGDDLRQSIEVFIAEPRNVSGLEIGEIAIDDSIARHRHVEREPLGEVVLRGPLPPLRDRVR